VLSVVPLRPGDCPSFYRPRRRQFTGVPHCSSYVCWYGVQCCGVDGRPGESCLWRGVMACPVSVQERLRGWQCRSRPFGRRLCADSRVQLTGGHTGHSSGRGGVLSPRAPTTPGMALQCPGWRRDDGDGRTGPMATEVTRLTGPTSRRGPGRAQNRHPSPFQGLRRPPSRVLRIDRTRVGGTVSRS
jgi:hypothetical protein